MSADSLCDAVFCIGRVGPGNAASNQIFERNLDFRASLRNVCLLFYSTTEILMQALPCRINFEMSFSSLSNVVLGVSIGNI